MIDGLELLHNWLVREFPCFSTRARTKHSGFGVGYRYTIDQGVCIVLNLVDTKVHAYSETWLMDRDGAIPRRFAVILDLNHPNSLLELREHIAEWLEHDV